MKKAQGLIMAIILFSITTLKAQEEDLRLKPIKGDWGFSFNLSGLITDLQLNANKDMLGNSTLFVRHYLLDDLALRAGFGINSIRTKSIRKDSVPQIPAFVEFDSLFSRFDLALSFGVEKHIESMRRLDPYVGAEVMLQFIGKENSSWNYNVTSASGTTSIEGERKVDGGFGIGVLALAGFNYFITEKISLGAEYRFGYYSMKFGGNFSESEITTPPTGSVSSVFNKGTAENRLSGFEVSSSANIIFSIFF